ncbi:MAG: hypothetical protein HOE54_06885 [Gammaproteobacteria bacterium]|jgi:hypothetical protein|nr:hypothetical protein [Gammaproteobacteria bacterium]
MDLTLVVKYASSPYPGRTWLNPSSDKGLMTNHTNSDPLNLVVLSDSRELAAIDRRAEKTRYADAALN